MSRTPVKPEFGQEPEVIHFGKRRGREARAQAYHGFGMGGARRPGNLGCRPGQAGKTQPLAPGRRRGRGQVGALA
jgi:hypothetical protein